MPETDYRDGDEYKRELERLTARNTADAIERLSGMMPRIEWSADWRNGACEVQAEAVPDEGTIRAVATSFHVGASAAQIYRQAKEAAQDAMKQMLADQRGDPAGGGGD